MNEKRYWSISETHYGNVTTSWILTWSADKTARLWDARTGKMGPTLRHGDLVGGARFSKKDERRILTWSNDKTVRLWNMEDLDFPAENVDTWVQAVTGTKLDVESRQLRVIEPDEWRKVRTSYESFAKDHEGHRK